jgi:hypothetical protein
MKDRSSTPRNGIEALFAFVAMMTVSGCCESVPEAIWNAGSYPSFGDTWRCESPIGEACFTFDREGIVEITEAGGLGTGVHNWESECSGLVLYGPFYDEAVLSGFDGGTAERRLSFSMDWDDTGISGTAQCVLEALDPSGHVCP